MTSFAYIADFLALGLIAGLLMTMSSLGGWGRALPTAVRALLYVLGLALSLGLIAGLGVAERDAGVSNVVRLVGLFGATLVCFGSAYLVHVLTTTRSS